MKIHFVRIAMFGIMSVMAASAQAQTKPLESIDTDEDITVVNQKTIVPALSVVSANHVVQVDENNSEMIVATLSNGLRFEVRNVACEDAIEDTSPHCRGMYMISRWDALPAGMDAQWMAAEQKFRLDHPAMNAGTAADGSPYVARYVIADYGTKQGNLVAEFANFARNITDFQNMLGSLAGPVGLD